jgi:hypothetical protein
MGTHTRRNTAVYPDARRFGREDGLICTAATAELRKAKEVARETPQMRMQNTVDRGEQLLIDDFIRTGRTDPLLTTWCKLGGQPYSLTNYPQFRPMFNMNAAPIQVWQCARQVGKSENLTSSRYIRGVVRENYNTLMVCPRYEQTRRLSVDKAQPLMKNSVPGKLHDATCVQRALERELINGNKVQYTHCYRGPDAARGFSVQGICYDETQDIVLSYADIIDQCMSGSKIYYDKLYSGTPKETTGTLSVKFDATSQGYWATKCPHCAKWSIASDEVDSTTGLFHVELMIGDTGPRCLHCHKSLEDAPLRGQYVHRFRDRIGIAEGYHVPQVVHYAHWGSQTKWNVLLDFYKGNPILDKDPLPRVTFVNEILGLPMDSEEMLIKPTEIERVSTTQPNELVDALKRKGEFSRILMCVDWSGFGNESASSHTAIGLVGESRKTGHPEAIYLERLPKEAGVTAQIKMIESLWKQFNPFAFVHDGCGAGMQQELLLLKGGIIPAQKVVAMMYEDAPVRKFVCEQSKNQQRRGLTLDKTRSLLLFFLMLQRRRGWLPEYKSAKACTNDFLSLYRDTRSGTSGVSRLRIIRKAGKPDDFAHCLNYGFTYIWYRRGEYQRLHDDTTINEGDD